MRYYFSFKDDELLEAKINGKELSKEDKETIKEYLSKVDNLVKEKEEKLNVIQEKENQLRKERESLEEQYKKDVDALPEKESYKKLLGNYKPDRILTNQRLLPWLF